MRIHPYAPTSLLIDVLNRGSLQGVLSAAYGRQNAPHNSDSNSSVSDASSGALSSLPSLRMRDDSSDDSSISSISTIASEDSSDTDFWDAHYAALEMKRSMKKEAAMVKLMRGLMVYWKMALMRHYHGREQERQTSLHMKMEISFSPITTDSSSALPNVRGLTLNRVTRTPAFAATSEYHWTRWISLLTCSSKMNGFSPIGNARNPTNSVQGLN